MYCRSTWDGTYRTGVAKTPQFDDADLELELKPIIEKDSVGFFPVVLNPVFEKRLYGRGHDKASSWVSQRPLYRLMKYISLVSNSTVPLASSTTTIHSAIRNTTYSRCYGANCPMASSTCRTRLWTYCRLRPRDGEIQLRAGALPGRNCRRIFRRQLRFF